MLSIVQDPAIREEKGTYVLDNDVKIFCKSLVKEDAPIESALSKTAIYIHGGGSGGNHTIVQRPSYWLIEKGLFGKILLPDRRGAGWSSPLTKIMTYEDHARDMKDLLDSMGITQKITAIGVSYGGPIALELAAMDSRVDEVILVASSPSLQPAKGMMGFLYKHHLLEPIVRVVYKKIVGKLEEAYPDFDGIYDVENEAQLKSLFLDGMKHTPNDRFTSLLLENASTCNLDNQGIAEDVRLSIPVYRVIGTRDEVWEVDPGDLYQSRIPHMMTRYIQGASHKDVFFRAEEFYQALADLLHNPG